MPKPDSEPEMTAITLHIPQTLLDRVKGKAIQDGLGLEEIAVNALSEALGVPKQMETAFTYNLPRTPRKSGGSTIGTTPNKVSEILWTGLVTIQKTGNEHHHNMETRGNPRDNEVFTLVRDNLDNVVKTLNDRPLRS